MHANPLYGTDEITQRSLGRVNVGHLITCPSCRKEAASVVHAVASLPGDMKRVGRGGKRRLDTGLCSLYTASHLEM